MEAWQIIGWWAVAGPLIVISVLLAIFAVVVVPIWLAHFLLSQIKQKDQTHE